MPGDNSLKTPGAVLFNHKTGSPEFVPSERIQGALASGDYSGGETTTVTQTPEGLPVTRSVAGLPAASLGGETPDIAANAITGQTERERRVREDFDTAGDKLNTFSEGVIDAMSMGLLHETGEGADIRRDVNSGSAFIGQVIGTFTPGPGTVMNAGRALGKAAGKIIMKEASTAATRVVARALEGAAAGGMLMGAQSIGHQTADAVFADKPWVASAVLHDVKLGLLLGGGLEGAGGLIGEKLGAGSRAEVAGSGGLVDPTSPESLSAHSKIQEGVSSFHDILETRAANQGVMEVLAKEGHNVPKRFVADNGDLVKAADRARQHLASLDMDHALSGSDNKAFVEWRDAMEDYQKKVAAVDTAMSPRLGEKPPAEATPQPPAPVRNPTQAGLEANKAEGNASGGAVEMHATMEGSPALRAKYQEIYGRPYEAPGELQQLEPGYENLNREVSPAASSGEKTNPRGKVQINPVERSGTQTGSAPGPRPGDLRAESLNLPVIDARQNAEAFARFRESALGDSTSSKLPPAEQPAARPAGTFADLKNIDEALKKDRTAPAKPDLGGPPSPESINKAPKSSAVDRFMNNWYQEALRSGPKITPGDIAAGKLGRVMDEIRQASGGQLDSAAAVDLFTHEKISPAQTTFGSQIDQIYAARRIARHVADASRGVSTPLEKAAKSRILGLAGKILSVKAMGALGITGLPKYILGSALSSKLFGQTGRAAASAGRLNKAVLETAASLLKNNKGLIGGTVALNSFGNKPYAYSDVGPIKDPIERIQEIRRVAANPAALQDHIKNQLGAFGVMHPEVADSLAKQATTQVIQLSIRAPKFVWDAMGNIQEPAANEMRRFHSFENATHDVLGLLHAVQNRTANEQQIDALHTQHPEVQHKLLQGLFADPDAMQRASRSQLKMIEQVSGLHLSVSGTPAFMARQMAAWAVHEQAKMNNGAVTPPAQTPADAGARAPGN